MECEERNFISETSSVLGFSLLLMYIMGILYGYIMLWALGPVRLLVPHTYASYIKALMYILSPMKYNTIVQYF